MSLPRDRLRVPYASMIPDPHRKCYTSGAGMSPSFLSNGIGKGEDGSYRVSMQGLPDVVYQRMLMPNTEKARPVLTREYGEGLWNR